MLAAALSVLRCPRCSTHPLRGAAGTVSCTGCGHVFEMRSGVLDMMESGEHEVITPFQRIMQTPLVVAIYERLWRRAGYWMASSRSFAHEMDTILRLDERRDTRVVLDLACGPGIFTRPLAARAQGLVIGLDLSWPMLQRASRMLEREKVRNVVLIRGSAFRLPVIDGSITLLNCCGALHLFERPEAALSEMQRVVMPGGHLSVQTTIRPERSAGIAYLLERFIRFGFFDLDGLSTSLARHRFEILESERHRISYTFLARHIS